jgi:hypothetical protein
MVTGVRDFRSLEEYRQWLRMRRLFNDYPLDVIRQKGLERIPRVMSKVSGSYYRQQVEEWHQALLDPDSTRLREIALDTSQYGVTMRQINPLYGIMKPEDVRRVIKDSRDEQRRVLSSAQSVIEHH